VDTSDEEWLLIARSKSRIPWSSTYGHLLLGEVLDAVLEAVLEGMFDAVSWLTVCSSCRLDGDEVSSPTWELADPGLGLD
jgi:hypothetical protein